MQPRRPDRYPTDADERAHPLVELLARVRATAPAEVVDLVRPAGHDPATYLEVLEAEGFEVDAWETTYLHVLSGEDAVLDWIGGTSLLPTRAALPPELFALFAAELGRRLRAAYPARRGRVVLPFRRVVVVATRRGCPAKLPASNVARMSQLASLWRTTIGLPVIGDSLGPRVVSFVLSRKAPYFASIRPVITQLRPNHASVLIRDRRRVHNHIGTVHAIALCNGLEMAMGALAEVTIPADKRWIPKGMEVAYTAKASSDIVCIAETDQEQWDTADGDLPVRVRGVRDDGTVVVEGVIKLWVTPKK